MTPMTEPVSARPAWPRNLGRAMRDAAFAVALGVVIGLAYARISAWPVARPQGGLAVSDADSIAVLGAGLHVPACASSPSVASAPAGLPACRPRAE